MISLQRPHVFSIVRPHVQTFLSFFDKPLSPDVSQEHQANQAPVSKDVFEDLAALAAEMDDLEDLEEMAVTKVNAMKGPLRAGRFFRKNIRKWP